MTASVGYLTHPVLPDKDERTEKNGLECEQHSQKWKERDQELQNAY
jgi:hypothetical protein